MRKPIDHYKLYNNEQSSVANLSDLGASLNSTNISCISLADDSVLLSNSIINLRNLLYLTTRYCAKYDVELVPDKTALLAFIPSGDKVASCDKEIIELSLNDHKIPFVDQTTHLGVVRTVCPGNMAAIVDRMTAHRRKVFAILHLLDLPFITMPILVLDYELKRFIVFPYFSRG